ncbi:MAG: class I SAM-dependent RNA methyltransferase, partial [Bellilinea sp.]
LPSAVILGSDRDAGAILTARQNAERAGVADWVQFSQAAISAINPPRGPGWVVTNPPYGVRISASNDLRSLYAQFGNVLKKQCPGWTTAFLCNDDHLASLTRLKFEKGVSLNNGGIPVKLSIGKVLPE